MLLGESEGISFKDACDKFLDIENSYKYEYPYDGDCYDTKLGHYNRDNMQLNGAYLCDNEAEAKSYYGRS